jgi:hypothetical protein
LAFTAAWGNSINLRSFGASCQIDSFTSSSTSRGICPSQWRFVVRLRPLAAAWGNSLNFTEFGTACQTGSSFPIPPATLLRTWRLLAWRHTLSELVVGGFGAQFGRFGLPISSVSLAALAEHYAFEVGGSNRRHSRACLPLTRANARFRPLQPSSCPDERSQTCRRAGHWRPEPGRGRLPFGC